MNTTTYYKKIIKITPTKQLSDITHFIHKQLELREILHKNGAMLFRGFNINSSAKFKQIAAVLFKDLMITNGEHIPDPVIKGVFAPVSYSPKKKLLWHNENSYDDTWPLMIMFGCIIPAEVGGETPIVDSRKVLANIDSSIVEEFNCKGVMYVRSHGFGFGVPWQKIYGTENKFELEQICKKKNITIEWKGDDKFITKQIRPALIQHPITREMTWFNQAQHWHPFCLDQFVRDALMEKFPLDELPRNCYFGDGSLIPDDIMRHILDVYREQEISFKWLIGDVLILDNVLFAHARNPYSGFRKLLVSMGN